MSVAAIRPETAPAPPDQGVRPRQWTRKEYNRAAELGLFGPEERLELLDGEIIRKMTPGGPHAAVVTNATELLSRSFGTGYHVRAQQPLILNNRSEPEPDLVVVPGIPFDYLPSHPKAADARLVVEVSDTTLRFDRNRKQAAYARAGVVEYWIINLLERQVEVYRDPSGARYRSVTLYREPEVVTPLAAPHASLSVSDLLPPVPETS
jgi:Uma2 family endonuclease